tara:strand:- start:45837 stop:46034 length:198 start_codon:yes stop_codon:yes gene_type:complete
MAFILFPYLGFPSLFPRFPANTFHAAFVHWVAPFIHAILAVSYQSQVFDSIIPSISVDVINLLLW